MDIQDNFSKWFGAYRDTVTRSVFLALAADLKLLIAAQRTRYWDAAHRIATDLADGESRGPWKQPRLRLSLTALAEHMQARRDRADAQQQLSVLVPLARRVAIAVQHWQAGRGAPAAVLAVMAWLLPLTVHLKAGHSAMRIVPKHLAGFGYGSKAERALAEQLVHAHPAVFYKPTPTPRAPAVAASAAAHTDAIADFKARLYLKIVNALELTKEEQDVLGTALKPTAA